MHCIKKITKDILWIGASDRRLALFENVFPIPRGISYNSYILLDEKTVLLDTVDKAVSEQFFQNLEYALNGRPLDYLVVNHMEPDHCASMNELLLRYPDLKIVGNSKAMTMINNFFDFDIKESSVIVKEGDTLNTGTHTLSFYMAPMVHWPEVMVTYDKTDKVLFTADAFGTFGAINGNLFADEVNFEKDWLFDARSYYANIVGKYGVQVTSLLKKMEKLDIKYICSLHGPVWRDNISWFINKYKKWASYTPEEPGVMIAYASVYGHTENAADILASTLADLGIKNIEMFDVSVVHPSVIVAESFRFSHLVFASTTYNTGIFCNMETALLDLKAHNLQNRTVALIENGSWAPSSGKLMKEIFDSMKNINVLDNIITIKSALKSNQRTSLEQLAEEIAKSVSILTPIPDKEKIENPAMFTLSYGLFVLSAKDGKKDNGCIINTVTQITDTPVKRISVAVNKANLTNEMIKKTGAFNISVLTTDAPFELFKLFGFQSGRDVDKFDGVDYTEKSENGILYLTKYTNAFISARVIAEHDYGTHTVFIAEVTETKKLNNDVSITYAYYFANTKPKPKPKTEEKKKGFICTICGYIYEGDVLPPDFICPICKHGAEVFVPLK